MKYYILSLVILITNIYGHNQLSKLVDFKKIEKKENCVPVDRDEFEKILKKNYLSERPELYSGNFFYRVQVGYDWHLVYWCKKLNSKEDRYYLIFSKNDKIEEKLEFSETVGGINYLMFASFNLKDFVLWDNPKIKGEDIIVEGGYEIDNGDLGTFYVIVKYKNKWYFRYYD